MDTASQTAFRVKLPEGLSFNAVGQSIDWMQYRCRSGFYANSVSQLIVDFIQRSPETTVLDIGANYGYFSLLAATTSYGRSTSFALEADPAVFEALQANIAVNPQLSGVTPLLMGEGRRTGGAVVDLADIDAFCRGRGISPELIRIDVRGYEEMVLRGMTQTLLSDCVIFLKLYADDWRSRSLSKRSDILQWLLERGLKVFSLNGFRRYQQYPVNQITMRLLEQRSADIDRGTDAMFLISRQDIRSYWSDLSV